MTDILQAGYEGLLVVRVGDDVRLDYAAELTSLGPVILGILEDSPPRQSWRRPSRARRGIPGPPEGHV